MSGGGNEKQSFPLDKFFFDSFPINGHFLYVPIALRGHKLYPTAHLWMKEILELHNRTDIIFEVADDLSLFDAGYLKKFNAIYIGGGNTWSLMKEIKECGFDVVLKEYFNQTGNVYGGSAGAIILGERIDTHEDENKVEFKDILGLSMLRGYSIACHFKEEQKDNFKKWALTNNLPIICLPEETGLCFAENISCEGTLSCVVFSSDGTERIIAPGEII